MNTMLYFIGKFLNQFAANCAAKRRFVRSFGAIGVEVVLTSPLSASLLQLDHVSSASSQITLLDVC